METIKVKARIVDRRAQHDRIIPGERGHVRHRLKVHGQLVVTQHCRHALGHFLCRPILASIGDKNRDRHHFLLISG